MPAWIDQDEDKQPERQRVPSSVGMVPAEYIPFIEPSNRYESARPCGCDMGCKPAPHYCEQHRQIPSAEEMWQHTRQPLGSTLQQDTCPRCGTLGSQDECPECHPARP